MKALLKRPLWQQILIGMVIGVVIGLVFKEQAAHLKPLGDLFIRLIKMLVVPLVLFTLISGVASLGDPATLGRIGAKAFALYIITAAIAITIGIAVAELFAPGVGLSLDLGNVADVKAPEARGFAESILEMIPTNPFAAMVEANMLQIIVFAMLFGVAASLSKEKSKPFVEFCDSASEICFTLTLQIMKIAPLGVMGIIAWVVGTQDPEVLLSLSKLVLVFFCGVLLHVVFVFGGSIYLLLRLSPAKFFSNTKEALIMAFSTSSSSATLPVTMKVVQNKLGVSETTSSFALPLGATVNMNGSALFQGVCAVFIAQAIGVQLTFDQYATITFTSILAAIGTAGIPGAGLLMLTLVLTSVGLPAEGIALILGVERIMDMVRTTVNVAGDAFVALVIDMSEKKHDRGIFDL